MFKLSGDLKKSQDSFEKYFKLTDDYKIDILLDYADVFENNNGYQALKTQLGFFPKNETTELLNLMKTSIDENDLYKKLLSVNGINKNLIKWAVLTIPPTIGNSLAYDKESFFNWIYNCMTFHVDLGYYCENVHQFFLNKSKAQELIQTNTFTNKPGYFFYIDYKKNGQSSLVGFSRDILQSKKGVELDSLYLVKRDSGWFR